MFCLRNFIVIVCAALLSSIMTVSLLLGGAYYVWQSGKWTAFFDGEKQQSMADPQSVEVVLSADDLRKMREKLTNSERASLFTTVVKKVPPEELEQLSKWLESGLTASEIRRIKQLSEQYFTTEELAEMMRWIEQSP